MVNNIRMNKQVFDRITSDLELSEFDNIGNYISSTEKGVLLNVYREFVTTINQVAHFIFTGIWINQTLVGKLINEYRFDVEISEEEEKKLKEAFDRVTGQGTYDDLFEHAMKGTWADTVHKNFSFLANFFRDPLTVGAVLPSSENLAKKVVKHISPSQNGEERRYFLEVGPGTGEFTYEIVKKMGSSDKLDLVEFDEQFCKILRQRFGHLKNVKIHHISITDWNPDGYKYDAIVSGLPLNSFSNDMVNEIYNKFRDVAKEDANLSYFEYPLLPRIKRIFLDPVEKNDLDNVLETKNSFYQKHKNGSSTVWLNAPPAKAKHCKISKQD